MPVTEIASHALVLVIGVMVGWRICVRYHKTLMSLTDRQDKGYIERTRKLRDAHNNRVRRVRALRHPEEAEYYEELPEG